MGHYKEAAKGSIRWQMEQAEAERERCRKLRSKPGTALYAKHQERRADAERAVEEVRALRERRIADNLGMVYRQAWKFNLHPRIDRDDVISEGFFGLISAVEEYDPERGVPFLAYASPIIWGRMAVYLQGGEHVVRVPIDRTRDRSKELQAYAERARQTPFSLSHRDSKGQLFIDFPAREEAAEDYDRYDALYAAMRKLPKKYRRVLELYYLKDLTLKEAGKKLGCTRQNCQEMLHRSLRAMKRQMGVCA